MSHDSLPRCERANACHKRTFGDAQLHVAVEASRTELCLGQHAHRHLIQRKVRHPTTTERKVSPEDGPDTLLNLKNAVCEIAA